MLLGTVIARKSKGRILHFHEVLGETRYPNKLGIPINPKVRSVKQLFVGETLLDLGNEDCGEHVMKRLDCRFP